MRKFLSSVIGLFLPALLLAAHLAVMMCYIERWDEVATVTLVPFWGWGVLAIVASGISWVIFRTRLAAVTFFIWFFTLILCADESRSLFREFRYAMTGNDPAKEISANNPKHVRVVTLNAAKKDDSVDAVREILHQNPDIIFLQEAPAEADLRELAREFFGEAGSFVNSWNCAILARGKLTLKATDKNTSSIYATLESPDRPTIDLINVDLQLAATRFDLWRESAWAEHTAIRKENRENLRNILTMAPANNVVPQPTIVGGDFGTPPTDDIFRLFRPQQGAKFTDSYRAAGIGWGNTYPSDYPLLRIDQFWHNAQLKAVAARVIPTKHTDHRMMVCDYLLAEPEGTLAHRLQQQRPLALTLMAANPGRK